VCTYVFVFVYVFLFVLVLTLYLLYDILASSSVQKSNVAMSVLTRIVIGTKKQRSNVCVTDVCCTGV
jgi:hypothetical protein